MDVRALFAAGGALLLFGGGASARASAPPSGTRRGRAPRDPNNYSDSLERYPGDPHAGAVIDGHTHRTPSGPRYKVANLPRRPETLCAWVGQCLALLSRVGLTDRRVATLVIAHWHRETGAGRYCWNHNFGNIKQFGGGAWHRLTDGEPYVTYLSAEDGIRANLAVLRAGRYATAWAQLQAGKPEWYLALGRAGYYGDASTPDGIERAAQAGFRQYTTTYLPQVQQCTG